MIPLLLLAAVGTAGHLPATELPSAVERRLALMGTRLDLQVAAEERSTALTASERAVRALEAAEARLSTWRADTELARLNAAPPGRPVPLSPELAAELSSARSCWDETGGAFDPTVGALSAAWGLRTGGREPTESQRQMALADTGMTALELDRAGEAATGDPVVGGPTAVWRRAGPTIDEGGFGKGAGLRAALATLAETGATSAALDLGGQWAFLGHPRNGWRIAVADPRDRDRPVALLTVERGSIATSGNSERGIVVRGRRWSHLIDPRTGWPAADFGSLTVWARDPLRADCLSTGLYVLGADAALAWTARHPGVEILVLTPRGKSLQARATPGLARRLVPLVENLEVQIATPDRADTGGARSAVSREQPRAPLPGKHVSRRRASNREVLNREAGGAEAQRPEERGGGLPAAKR